MGIGGDADRVRQLMAAFRSGDKQAANELVEIFHPELRRLAASYMRREKAGHSWQPTLLVNELYLQMIKIRALRPVEQDGGDDKAAFLSLAGLLMRRLLIHHARPLSQRAERREIHEDDSVSSGFESLAEMDQLLDRLEWIKPRLRSIVELRVFEGLTGDEIAERLDCAPATVARDWNFARRWLEKELSAKVLS